MNEIKHSWAKMMIAIVAALAVIASGCGGDDDDAGGSADAAVDEPRVDESNIEAPADEPADEGGSDDGAGDDGSSAAVDDEADFAPAPTPPPAEAPSEEIEAEEEPADAASGERTAGGLFDDEAPPEVIEPPVEPDPDRDGRFEDYGIRDFVDTDDDPLSTFALDVDTGSYTVGRSFLNDGLLPPRESVRPEEYINVFDYGYDEPRRNALGISIDGGPSPFDDRNVLVRIGVQSVRLEDDERPEASLTFVIDTSGSMEQDGRLELVKEALEELVTELDDDDTIAIVEFDDDPTVVLGPTEVADDDRIFDALDDLRPGGSTNVEAGLLLGYDLAAETYDEDRVNRVILLSDGIANVGLIDPDGLAELIRRDADRGIQLLTIGVGLGDFNDVLMEQLADQGDGFYAYVDTEDEAERLFEDNLTATLVTVAIDAKIQVEFDPDVVDEYRLIGFENRGVLDSEFRNDDVDAGEVGAGHQVTAIYELELRRDVELGDRGDLGEVRLRWEEPNTDGEVIEIDEDIEIDVIEERWDDTSDSFKLAVVVATFAEVLRDSPFADDIDVRDLEDEADDLARRMNVREVDELSDLISIAERLL